MKVLCSPCHKRAANQRTHGIATKHALFAEKLNALIIERSHQFHTAKRFLFNHEFQMTKDLYTVLVGIFKIEVTNEPIS